MDLRSGQRVALPRSEFSSHYRSDDDQWYADPLVGDLVRVDGKGDVAFFDRRSLRQTGGFSLAAVPGADQPKLYSPLKPSRDGRYLLGYWKKRFADDNPVLAVFDRSGRVIQADAPLARGSSARHHAFDWLPNNQFVYVVDDKVVLGGIGNWSLGAAPLRLPLGTEADGELAVSPDAKRIVLSASTPAADAPMSYKILFTANLNGSDLRPLTAVGSEPGTANIRQAHTSPSWSPSGKWIAFSLSSRAPVSPTFWLEGCPPALAVPADATQQRVRLLKPDAGQLLAPAGGPAAQRPLPACGAKLLWIQR